MHRNTYMKEYYTRDGPREKIKERALIRRAKMLRKINRVKLWCGCRMCGWKVHPSGLHFHHRDPTEKYKPIGKMVGCSWARLKDEIRKCVVLCANCHAMAHAESWEV